MNNEATELVRIAKSLTSRTRKAGWMDLHMQVNGTGDLAKAKKIVARNMGKDVASRGQMLGMFIYLDYQVEPDVVEKTLSELKRAGLQNVKVSSSM